MNEDRLKGNWKQLKGELKQAWADLTDQDLTEADGRTDVLVGKLQERYGLAKDEAARKLNAFLDKFDKNETADKGAAE